MKKLLFSFLIMFILTNASLAGNVDTAWYDSLSEGLRIANVENRDIIVDFYTDWCGWCKRLSKEVFSTKEFKDFTKNRFVLVKINAEDYRKTTKKYRISGYPSILILDNYGKEVDRVVGYAPKDKYIEMLREAAYSLNNFKNLKKFAQERPDDRHVNFALARKYYERKMYNEAKLFFTKAVNIDDTYWLAYLHLGHIAQFEGRVDDARMFYRKASNNTNHPEEILYRASIVSFNAGENERASQGFRKYIEKKTGNKLNNKIETCYYYLFLTYIKSNLPDDAEGVLDEFMKKYPKAKKTQTYMANILKKYQEEK